MLYSFRSFLLSIFLIILFSSTAEAISVIVTEAPRPQEILVEPRGYTRCYSSPPGFYHNVWHYRHRVCEYPDNDGLRIWIAGYWQCTGFDYRGRCTRTLWIGSHWALPNDWDYQIVYERDWRHHRGHHGNHHGQVIYTPGPNRHQHHRQEYDYAPNNNHHGQDHGHGQSHNVHIQGNHHS